MINIYWDLPIYKRVFFMFQPNYLLRLLIDNIFQVANLELLHIQFQPKYLLILCIVEQFSHPLIISFTHLLDEPHIFYSLIFKKLIQFFNIFLLTFFNLSILAFKFDNSFFYFVEKPKLFNVFFFYLNFTKWTFAYVLCFFVNDVIDARQTTAVLRDAKHHRELRAIIITFRAYWAFEFKCLLY